MNILFRASAGTGKTWQVSSLYTALVLGRPYEARDAEDRSVRLTRHGPVEPVPPDRMVLMTFTDNAAAELRVRVAARVLEARQTAVEQNRPDEAALAARVLRALPGAPICTIHSFCADLLRENALDAGLSPGFVILDEEAAGRLLDEAAREELLARLDRRPAGGRPSRYDADFEAFCRGMRVLGASRGPTVLQAAQALLRQAAGKGLDLARAEDWLPPPRQSVTPADFETILEDLRRIRAGRGGRLPEGAAKAFQSLENNLKKIPKIGKEADLEKFALALDEEVALTFSGKDLGAVSKRLQAAAHGVLQTAAYKTHHPAVRAFARYAAAVTAAYTARKRALQGVDFDDLLVMARDLLERNGPAARRYDYLLLDEAQDTSRIQCEILRRLWDPAVNHLVLCGDTKQSIYAWRNADPRVMPDLEAAQRATASFRFIALRKSFRSKDAILHGVNRLFAGVYGEDYTADEHLAPAPERGADTAGRGEGPCIELLEPADNTEGDEGAVPDREARARAEMNAIAGRLRLLVDGPAAWRPKFRFNATSKQFEPAGKNNGFRYADILVLLRSTTRQPLLEQALHRCGIPYRVGGHGRGLFARQEATDLLLLLKLLAHPRDSLALMGFLRSPWAGLSDETLLQLGWSGPGFDETAFRRRVLEGLEHGAVPKLPEDSPELDRLANARALIRKYGAQVDCRPTAAIVRDAIRETGYDAVLAATFRGEQRLANLDKLLRWIEQAERGPARLAAETAAEMERLVNEPPEQPEATLLDPEQNVITLMTIHGAKGLTAGVVVVPELGSSPTGAPPWALLEDGPGERTGILHVKTEEVDRTPVTTPGYEPAVERAGRVREAEAKNLFYVALTRARDLVILSGDAGTRKPAPWLAAVHEFLGSPAVGGPPLLCRRSYPEVSRAAREAGLSAARTSPPRTWPAGWPVPARLFDAAEAAFAAPSGPTPILRYPATTLSAYLHDPRAFTPGPEEGGAAPDGSRREEDDDAAAFGTAGHEMLEQLALSGWPADATPLLNALGAARTLDKNVRDDLLRRVERAARHLATESRGAQVATEWPFALKLENRGVVVIVDGTADLVITRGDRRQVVDYKFTEDPPERLAARYGLQLNLYREALARRDGVAAESIAASVLAIRREGIEVVEIPPEPGCAARAVEAAAGLYELEK